MTEDEAKKRWCPMVRMGAVMPEGVASVNRVSTDQGTAANCIGSGCMMWRWEMEYHGEDWIGKDFEKEQRRLQKKGGRVTNIDQYDPSGTVCVPSKYGYCGLAGKP